MLVRGRHAAALSLLLALGCGDDDTPQDGGVGTDAGMQADASTQTDAGAPAPAACDPLQPIRCFLPYPSSHFLAEDSSTETGFRVNLTNDIVPENVQGNAPASLRSWNDFDGFSPMTSIMTAFAGELDTSLLNDENNIGDSLEDDAHTIIIDAETGERVPHWAEIDQWVPAGDADGTTLYLRPANRFEENHRYVVALRGLRSADGELLEASPAFAAYRDDESGDANFEARKPAMNAVFDTLTNAGIARSDLLLAWDFHTASGESIRGDMLRMRSDALSRLEAQTDGVGTCTVTEVEEMPGSDIFRRIRGTYRVPSYMERPEPGTIAQRNADGEVEYNGTDEAPFEVVIPTSVATRITEDRGGADLLMYGHGLLGTSGQVSSGGPRAVAERQELIAFGTSYWGMANEDISNLSGNVLTNFGNFEQLGERLMQGTVNSLLLPEVMRTHCAALPEFQMSVGEETRPLIGGDHVYYYGISQGGIMGATIAALSEDIEAFVLQVGAIGYGHMVRRSKDFVAYEVGLRFFYPDPITRDWLIMSTQSMWDLAEPSSYAGHTVDNALPGVSGDRPRVLYQTSRYDTEVNNANSDIAARTMGIPALRSSVYEPYDTPLVDGDVPSAYVIFHLDDVEPQPIGTVQPNGDNNAHSDLRFLEPVLSQIESFLQPDGQVVDTCPDANCLIENTRR